MARSPADLLEAGRPLTLAAVADGAEGLVAADLARAVAARANAPATSLLVICRDGPRSAALARALAFFAPELAVLEFPSWDCLPYDRVSPHAGVVAQRMTAMSRLARVKGRDRPSVLLTTVNAALQRVPAKALVATQRLRCSCRTRCLRRSSPRKRQAPGPRNDYGPMRAFSHLGVGADDHRRSRRLLRSPGHEARDRLLPRPSEFAGDGRERRLECDERWRGPRRARFDGGQAHAETSDPDPEDHGSPSRCQAFARQGREVRGRDRRLSVGKRRDVRRFGGELPQAHAAAEVIGIFGARCAKLEIPASTFSASQS